MSQNVISNIVLKNLCCGCGICAGVASACDLAMGFNRDGEYVPSVSNCRECGLCLSVCPSNGRVNNSDNMKLPLGEYFHTYCGYSAYGAERSSGSSGGLVTRVLSALLDHGQVDGVVVVGPSAKKDRLFEPVIVRRSEDLINCAGTKYYPVEFSEVLRKIRSAEGSFAVVGLPCVIHGLRLVQERVPVIGRKIKYTLGLVCGHNKSKNYTRALLHYSGADKRVDLESVSFRVKGDGSALSYRFKARFRDGFETPGLAFQESIVKDLWCGYFFALPACFHCKDVFAVKADMSFMDAWLDPYVQDPRGTSIVVVRNGEMVCLVDALIEQGIVKLERIDEERVIASQYGSLSFKSKSFRAKRADWMNRSVSHMVYGNKTWTAGIGLGILKIYFQTKRASYQISQKFYDGARRVKRALLGGKDKI